MQLQPKVPSRFSPLLLIFNLKVPNTGQASMARYVIATIGGDLIPPFATLALLLYLATQLQNPWSKFESSNLSSFLDQYLWVEALKFPSLIPSISFFFFFTYGRKFLSILWLFVGLGIWLI